MLHLMTQPARDVLDLALDLPLEDRTQVVAGLLASLHGEPDEGVDEAWALEIRERVHRARAGEPAKDWDEVWARLQQKYAR